MQPRHNVHEKVVKSRSLVFFSLNLLKITQEMAQESGLYMPLDAPNHDPGLSSSFKN
jgi:hypothetical protein